MLDAAGKATKEVELDQAVFAAEVRSHLVHETVRAELNAARAGTRGGKSRGLVAGGRSKPWRQKGTGRARAGTTRAPQWTGGGLAFPPGRRDFSFKVNRKEAKAAFRSVLTSHASEGTLALLATDGFEAPSTKTAAGLVGSWGKPAPLVLVAADDEEAVTKSFRNLERVAVASPHDVEVAALVWARSLLITEASLETLVRRAL